MLTLKVRVSYSKVVQQTKAQVAAYRLSAPPLLPPPSPQPSLPESLSDTVLLDQGLDVGQGAYEVTFNDPVWSLVLVDGSGPEEIFESRETIQAWVLDSLGE